MHGDIAVQQMLEDNICAIVIQYDANQALTRPAHWLCFRKNAAGLWWNMDTMLQAPVSMQPSEVMYEPAGVWPHTPQGAPPAEHVEYEVPTGVLEDDSANEDDEE